MPCRPGFASSLEPRDSQEPERTITEIRKFRFLYFVVYFYSFFFVRIVVISFFCSGFSGFRAEPRKPQPANPEASILGDCDA